MRRTPAQIAAEVGPRDGAIPPYEYLLFVDEAGDLGLKVDVGDQSSEWFVLSGVVVSRSFEDRIVPWVQEIQSAIRSPARELHFRNLKPDKRSVVAQMVAALPVRAFVVASHKQNMRGHTNQRAAKRGGQAPFYNFCLRVLLERATSAIAASSIRRFGEPRLVRVSLAQTGGVHYSQTAAYIELLRLQAFNRSTYLSAKEVNPRVLHMRLVEPVSPKTTAGVQLADVVASAFYSALRPTSSRDPSLELAASLSPIIARQAGVRARFGLQLLPWDCNIPAQCRPIFERYGYTWEG